MSIKNYYSPIWFPQRHRFGSIKNTTLITVERLIVYCKSADFCLTRNTKKYSVSQKKSLLEITLVVKCALSCLWEFKLASFTVTQCTQRIIDEFNVLRQQPEIIRNAVRHVHKRTILCAERNGGHVKGHMVHGFKFHVNVPTIMQSFFLTCFDVRREAHCRE